MNTKTAPVILALALIGTSLAQPADSSEPGLLTVAIVQVKYDMMPEFEALQKEMSTALKEAGAQYRHIWQVARGVTNEYHIVSQVKNFGEYDGPSLGSEAMGEGNYARWVARITKCIENRRLLTIRPLPDLSIPAREGRVPKLAILMTRVSLPGRGPDYNTWMREKYLPAAKRAGMDGFYLYRNALGGSVREWITVTLLDNWSDLDQLTPMRQALTDEEYSEIFSGVGALTTNAERIVLRFRPELSIRR